MKIIKFIPSNEEVPWYMGFVRMRWDANGIDCSLLGLNIFLSIIFTIHLWIQRLELLRGQQEAMIQGLRITRKVTKFNEGENDG